MESERPRKHAVKAGNSLQSKAKTRCDKNENLQVHQNKFYSIFLLLTIT